MVFNLYDPKDPLRSVGLFVAPPIPFEELWSRAELIALPSGEVRVASIDDMIEMKKSTGRAQFRSIAASTPKQRLDWLEQALRFALACGALSRAETPEQRRRRGVS